MTFIAPEPDQVRRDLHWLQNSPDIISLTNIANRVQQTMHDGREFLQAATSRPSALPIVATNRLGHYFEQLCCLQLTKNRDVKLIASNKQIFHEKQTIGEFDLLLTSAEKNYHFEMAVKFYLQVGSGENLSDWVGPNLKDRFDNKYNRLAEHQLRLSKNIHAQGYLDSEKVIIQEIGLITRGRLFYPFNRFMKGEFNYPVEVTKNHLTGFWMTTEEFQNEKIAINYECYILPKGRWLSELGSNDKKSLTTFNSQQLEKVTAIVIFREQKEWQRGFIVPNEWYQLALERVNTD